MKKSINPENAKVEGPGILKNGAGQGKSYFPFNSKGTREVDQHECSLIARTDRKKKKKQQKKEKKKDRSKFPRRRRKPSWTREIFRHPEESK